MVVEERQWEQLHFIPRYPAAFLPVTARHGMNHLDHEDGSGDEEPWDVGLSRQSLT